ncbi:MAG TPA: DUF4012 domain-containing protein, partial [Ktedonobacterales bacterium]
SAAGADGELATPATQLVQRLGEARVAVGTAIESAAASANELVRMASPQLHRALDTAQATSAGVLRGLQPFTGRLAHVVLPLWVFLQTKLFRAHRTGVLATVVVISLLLGAILPPLLTLSSALSDYHQLSTLGDDGLHHLLTAKDDLSGLLSNVSGLDSVSGLLSTPPAAAITAPYEYEMQRQSGTDYPVSVTVHPSPSMIKAGAQDQQFSTTLDQNTTFAYGAPPAAPTATPTPTPTPAPSPTPGKPSSPSSSGSTTVNIQGAVNELRSANADFSQLRAKLNNPDWVLDMVGTLPGTKTKLSTVKALADVGFDATSMGIEFASALSPVLRRAEGGVLSGQADLITPTDLTALQRAISDATGYLADIQNRLPVVDISTLPITPEQTATFTAAIEQLPRVQSLLTQASPWVQALGWALGVGGTRHYLVQTLDKEELRPSGGFTGDYGVLTITNGKLDPLTIKFADNLDYNYFYACGCQGTQRPPSQYQWWPVTGFGLRDSNLSGDFPTTAKLNIGILKQEGNVDIDGVVQFTTSAIAHVLRVTGPVQIPIFNETVTADNLEAEIYYYQDDPAGIAKQQQLFPQDASSPTNRKHFLQSVSQVIQEQLKHLSTSEMLPLAKQALDDMKSKDLQIYLNNSQIENQLLSMHAAGAIDTQPNVDGYLMVQANVSYNKGTPCVQIAQHDDVTLDDKGGATHRWTATFYNNPYCNPYSFYTTYRDYVRIYTPPQARLVRGTGFDTGLPLCWEPPPGNPGAGRAGQFASVPYCPYDPYPDGELRCPAGYYGPGSIAALGDNWGLDVLGPPAQTLSDVAGRQMWGSWVVIPLTCTAKVTLRWYVPNMVQAG